MEATPTYQEQLAAWKSACEHVDPADADAIQLVRLAYPPDSKATGFLKRIDKSVEQLAEEIRLDVARREAWPMHPCNLEP